MSEHIWVLLLLCDLEIDYSQNRWWWEGIRGISGELTSFKPGIHRPITSIIGFILVDRLATYHHPWSNCRIILVTFDDSPVDYDDIVCDTWLFTYQYQSTKAICSVIVLPNSKQGTAVECLFLHASTVEPSSICTAHPILSRRPSRLRHIPRGIYSIQNGAVNTDCVSCCFMIKIPIFAGSQLR